MVMLRRDFCLGLLVSAVGFQNDPPRPADDPYLLACREIKQGRHFLRAAARLRKAAQDTPDDYRYPTALACALISRYASMMYAAGFTILLADLRKDFPDRLESWERAQKDPEDSNYGAPRPEMPPDRVFLFKDDRRPCRFQTAEERKAFKQEITALLKEANAAIAEARKRAKSTQERAEAAYMHGWCLHIQRLYQQVFGNSVFSPMNVERALDEPKEVAKTGQDESTPTEKEPDSGESEQNDEGRELMQNAFRDAVKWVPDNPLYWQALGYATEGEEQKKAYLHSLKYRPRTPSLWYLLYQEERDHASDESANHARIEEEALQYLHQAQKYDGGNACSLYFEADFLARMTDFTDPPNTDEGDQPPARSVISPESFEKMNRSLGLIGKAKSLELRLPSLSPMVPPLLYVAWSYVSFLEAPPWSSIDSHFRSLSSILGSYGRYQLGAGRLPEAEAAAQAMIDFGAHLIGNAPLPGSSDRSSLIQELSDTLRAMPGIDIANEGWELMVAVARATGNAQRLEATELTAKRFRQRSDAYSKSIENRMMNDIAGMINVFY